MSRQRATINWDKSFYLTAEQVGLLGLEDKSVAEMQERVDAVRMANAMDNLTVADLEKWKENLDL